MSSHLPRAVARSPGSHENHGRGIVAPLRILVELELQRRTSGVRRFLIAVAQTR
jgi:hypothetical protein